MENKKKLTVLIVEPDKEPYQKIIKDDLKELQEIVGGPIEAVELSNSAYIFCNEIAYGSNLNVTQMSMRCPTAKLIGSGVVKNYELLFRGDEENAVATIEPKEGSVVPVAIWEIGKEDEVRLDRYEGYPHLYGKQHIFVKQDNGFETKAMVYIMDNRYSLNVPSAYYLSVIQQGYEDVGLDKEILNHAVDNAIKNKDYEYVQMD